MVADAAAPILGIDHARVLEALMEREALGSTGLGGGVAAPHARLAGLDRVVGVFVRLDHPVAFDSVDDRPVDLLFGLFAPPESGAEHCAPWRRCRASCARRKCANSCARPAPRTPSTPCSCAKRPFRRPDRLKPDRLRWNRCAISDEAVNQASHHAGPKSEPGWADANRTVFGPRSVPVNPSSSGLSRGPIVASSAILRRFDCPGRPATCRDCFHHWPSGQARG